MATKQALGGIGTDASIHADVQAPLDERGVAVCTGADDHPRSDASSL